MMTDTKLRDWAEQLAAASPTMDPEQQRIALQVYRLIAETAEPVTITQIADGAGLSAARVEESLRAWPLVLRDDKDRVVGFWGIHAEHITPTHAIEVDGTTVYAWCAWDTLFITEILGRQTRVTSTDPHEGTPIRLTVTPDGVTSLEPPEAVVSLLLPEDGFTDDDIQRLCHKVHFFTSPESAQAWIDGRPGLFAVSVDEAFELGRITNRLRMGTVISGADRKAEAG
ncbi:MAG: organomercurial lyase [Acidimicrobiia bacterium]